LIGSRSGPGGRWAWRRGRGVEVRPTVTLAAACDVLHRSRRPLLMRAKSVRSLLQGCKRLLQHLAGNIVPHGRREGGKCDNRQACAVGSLSLSRPSCRRLERALHDGGLAAAAW
jgi:hypothetical protein